MQGQDVSLTDDTIPDIEMEAEFVRWVAVWLNSARIMCTQPRFDTLPGTITSPVSHAKHCLREARKVAELIPTFAVRERAQTLIGIVSAEVRNYEEAR